MVVSIEVTIGAKESIWQLVIVTSTEYGIKRLHLHLLFHALNLSIKNTDYMLMKTVLVLTLLAVTIACCYARPSHYYPLRKPCKPYHTPAIVMLFSTMIVFSGWLQLLHSVVGWMRRGKWSSSGPRGMLRGGLILHCRQPGVTMPYLSWRRYPQEAPEASMYVNLKYTSNIGDTL